MFTHSSFRGLKKNNNKKKIRFVCLIPGYAMEEMIIAVTSGVIVEIAINKLLLDANYGWLTTVSLSTAVCLQFSLKM